MKYLLMIGALLLWVHGCAFHGNSKGAQASYSPNSGKFFNSNEVNPEGNALLHYIDARLHKLLDEEPQALESLKRAVGQDTDSPYLHAELARHLADANQFEQAGLESDRALELAPKESEHHLLKGKLFSVKRQSDKAIEEYKECIALDPDQLECYTMLAREYMVQKEDGKAEKVIRSYLARDPSNPDALFFLASLNTKEEDLDKAIPLYERVLDEDPKYYKALTALAQIYLEKKNYPKALEYLLSWEQLAPNDIATKLRIGLLYYEQKNYPEAIQRFVRVLELEPDNDRVLYYLGILEAQNQDYPRAAEFFSRVEKKSRFYKDAVIRLALVLSEQNKTWQAITITKNALGEKKDIPDLYELLGNLYGIEEKYRDALKAYDQGLKRFPDQEDLLFSKGILLDKMGKFEESMAVMKRIVELNPDHAPALNYLGYSYADRNINLQEALQMLQKAHRLKPEDGYITDSLAWAHFRLGQLDPALSLLKQANEQSPKQPTILEHLGDVHLQMGQSQTAQGFYREALAASVDNPPEDERERQDLVRIQGKLAKLQGK
jgi:tetratricopeptide (TPR) repeat protein